MTKYRLKDADLQKKLDEISGNDFSASLEKIKPFNKDQRFSVTFGVESTKFICAYRCKIDFLTSDVEIVHEYNPQEWNRYPDVEPPEGVWMRLEVFRSNSHEQHTYRYYAKFLKSEWKNGEGGRIPIDELDDVRFRPWEEE